MFLKHVKRHTQFISSLHRIAVLIMNSLIWNPNFGSCAYNKEMLPIHNQLAHYVDTYMSWFMPCFPCTLSKESHIGEKKKKKDTKANQS